MVVVIYKIYISIGQVIDHVTVINQVLSLLEITAFRLERKSCRIFSKINFPPMRALEFLTGHVIITRFILTNSN